MCDLSWLPPLVTLDDTGGDYSGYYDLIYGYYMDDLVFNPPEFEGFQVETIANPMKQGKEKGFWHIIEGEDKDNLADTLDRHKRIRWIKPVIEAVGSDRVLMWKRPFRPGISKPHIVLPDFSFIVVLRQHPTYIKLVTGFPVEREKRRQDYRDEWEKYQKSL